MLDSGSARRVIIRHGSLRLWLVAVRLWRMVTLEDLLGVAEQFLTILQPIVITR